MGQGDSKKPRHPAEDGRGTKPTGRSSTGRAEQGRGGRGGGFGSWFSSSPERSPQVRRSAPRDITGSSDTSDRTQSHTPRAESARWASEANSNDRGVSTTMRVAGAWGAGETATAYAPQTIVAAPEGAPSWPVEFVWEDGGHIVFVSGSFDKWRTRIPLTRDPDRNAFRCVVHIAEGTHHYKYIVDGRWRHSTNHPIAQDSQGNLNNVLVVTPGEQETGAAADAASAGSPSTRVDPRAPPESTLVASPVAVAGLPTRPASPPGDYGQEIPHARIYDRQPPAAPPHLLRCILNTHQSAENPHLVPIPHHTQISHVYQQRGGTADTVLVVSTTHRYRSCEQPSRTKFVTTVFCSPAQRPAAAVPTDDPAAP